MFAFGFARLGDETTATQLRDEATRQLDSITTNREFHRLARTAFECRIAEALRGEPHTGTLDDRCPEVIAALLFDDFTTPVNSPTGVLAYVLGRLVEPSSILEPTRRFEPYRRAIRFMGGQPPPAWAPRETPSTDWSRLIETSDSPRALWAALPVVQHAHGSRNATRANRERLYEYCQWLPKLLAVARSQTFNVSRRFLSVVLSDLPPVGNTFSSAPFISRLHFAVIDPLVLAVVGSGPPPPEAERSERLELLRSVRTPVLTWVEAMP